MNFCVVMEPCCVDITSDIPAEVMFVFICFLIRNWSKYSRGSDSQTVFGLKMHFAGDDVYEYS